MADVGHRLRLRWLAGAAGVVCAGLGLHDVWQPYLDTHWQTAACFSICSVALLWGAARLGNSHLWYAALAVFSVLLVLSGGLLFWMRSCCMI